MGQTVRSDGKDAFSQLIDMAEVMGIVVVAAAGNDDGSANRMSTPAAATRAITVAASHNGVPRTPQRGDDDIAWFSTTGERQDDLDHDVIDELKPEVMAPGVDILAALFNTATAATPMSGTSMAAPHVAGLAALIMEQRPSINAASVKDLIISTAERRPVQWPPSAPGKDPEWNDGAGWGLIDAYDALSVGGATDLSYPNHPPTPSWMSPDISVNPSPKVGQVSTVTVQVENRGPAYASDVRIHFGVYDYTVSVPLFSDIGTQIVNLPVGVTPVSMNWTPDDPGHFCMETEIAYGPDTDYSNNKAQRNLQVASSPVEFRVQNTLTEEPALIEFVPTFDPPDTDWDVVIDPPHVELAADDCPEDVQVLLIPPPEAEPGETQIVHVAAMIGEVELGGVSVQDTVPALTPVVSEWGLIVLTLLLLTAVTLVVGRRRRPAAA